MKKLYFVSTEDTAALRENKLQIVLTDKFLSMDFEGNHKKLATTYKLFVKAFEQATADGVIPAAIAKKAEEMINPYPNGKLAETRDKDGNLIFTQDGDRIFFGAGQEPDGTLDAVFDFDDDRDEGFYIWFKMNLESYADSIAAIEAAIRAQEPPEGVSTAAPIPSIPPAEIAVDADKKITPAVAADASTIQNTQGEDTMKQHEIQDVQPKKVSSRIVSTLKQIEPHNFALRGILAEAPNGTRKKKRYICPWCGSGSHDHQTSALEYTSSHHVVQWFCHSCMNKGEGKDNIHLLAKHYGLDVVKDFPEICRRACQEFSISFETDDDYKSSPSTKKPASTPKKIPADRLKTINAVISSAQENLRGFIDEQGGSWRGLTFDTLHHFHCGYLPDWNHSKKFSKTPRVIIPASTEAEKANYLARLTIPEESIDDNTRRFSSAKEHDGEKTLFNPDALSAKLIVVVEGYIDAISIWQASNGEIAVVALGGANQGAALISAVDDRHITGKQFIILFDADHRDNDMPKNLQDELIKRGNFAVCKFLFDALSDSDQEKFGVKVDPNQILVDRGRDFLIQLVENIFTECRADFSALEKKIADDAFSAEKSSPDKKNSLLPAAQIDIPFNGYDFMEDTVEDLDNARRLEKFRGKYIHWLEDDERWLTFDGSIWSRRSEKNSCIYPFAVTFADQMMNFAKILDAKANDAAKASVITNSDGSIKKIDEKARKDAEIAKARRDKAFAIAYYFKKRKNYSAAIDLLKGCDSILITAADLNKHKNLLCVKNGVVDLQTGKLYPLAEKYLITNQADVSFDPNADTTFVEKFFSEVIPDEPTRQGVLRYLGYGLTGEKNYHICQFWRGRGANGKSTIIDMLIKLFGSYAIKLPTNAMIEAPRPLDPNAASPALAMLDGDIRLAILDEIPRNCRLDATTFKTITGDQFITARPLYCNPRKIELRAKLILNGNHLPNFDVDDGGLQRRINNVEYTQFFPADRADVTLPNKLTTQENRSALLKILVAQAQEFYRNGLIESDAMKDAKAEYFNENDFVASFVDEYCIVGDGGEIKRKDFESRLTLSYPAETSRLKKKDLLRIITDRLSKLGVAYTKDNHNKNIFSNIRWQS